LPLCLSDPGKARVPGVTIRSPLSELDLRDQQQFSHWQFYISPVVMSKKSGGIKGD